MSYKEGTNTEMIRFIIYLGAKISYLYQTEYSIVEKAITSIRTIVFHLFDIMEIQQFPNYTHLKKPICLYSLFFLIFHDLFCNLYSACNINWAFRIEKIICQNTFFVLWIVHVKTI